MILNFNYLHLVRGHGVLALSEDEKIVKYLKNSMKMKVVSTSSRGTITNDTYSLVGFSKAYQKINEACKKKK